MTPRQPIAVEHDSPKGYRYPSRWEAWYCSPDGREGYWLSLKYGWLPTSDRNTAKHISHFASKEAAEKAISQHPIQ